MKGLSSKPFVLDGGLCGGAGVADWYVRCDEQEHLTHVHEGQIITGDQLKYRELYGPDTEGNCNAWANQHYPDGFCDENVARPERLSVEHIASE
jgi:hypothetical protein